MKTIICLTLFSVISAYGLSAQKCICGPVAPMPQKIRVSAQVAEKMLIHKVNPVLAQAAMEARGATVLLVEIGRKGDVLHAKIISGPALHRKPVLDAVRQYRYKPYLLNDTPVEVTTTVSVSLNE